MNRLSTLASRILALLPSFPIMLVLAAILGAAITFAAFTFTYAQGYSYLVDDPNACANCHIMREQFDGWNRSAHQNVATCNDCHTPHESIVGKYAVKGLNGFNHSRAFTFGNFEEPIRITPFNREVTQGACLYCHGEFVSEIAHAQSAEPTDCLSCHEGVGHGR